jgi:hypothetical protein
MVVYSSDRDQGCSKEVSENREGKRKNNRNYRKRLYYTKVKRNKFILASTTTMATQDDSIMGLRTQILGRLDSFRISCTHTNSHTVENWRYVHPEHANVVILTVHHPIDVDVLEADDFVYGAAVAEDRSQGNRIFLRALSQYNIETALRNLLSLTNDLVKDVIKDTPLKGLEVKGLEVKGLEIKPVNQDFTSAELKKVEPAQNVNRGLGRSIIDARRKSPTQALKT